jgi:hypothetical protein
MIRGGAGRERFDGDDDDDAPLTTAAMVSEIAKNIYLIKIFENEKTELSEFRPRPKFTTLIPIKSVISMNSWYTL